LDLSFTDDYQDKATSTRDITRYRKCTLKRKFWLYPASITDARRFRY